MADTLQGCNGLESPFPLCQTGVKNRCRSTIGAIADCTAGRFQHRACHVASYPPEKSDLFAAAALIISCSARATDRGHPVSSMKAGQVMSLPSNLRSRSSALTRSVKPLRLASFLMSRASPMRSSSSTPWIASCYCSWTCTQLSASSRALASWGSSL